MATETSQKNSENQDKHDRSRPASNGMKHEHTIHPHYHSRQGTLRDYVTGFALSIVFTIIPYVLVVNMAYSRQSLIAAVVVFALGQLFVQLFFFLHLKADMRSRWNLLAITFTILVVLIVVVGSLWIMANLNANMMSPDIMNELMPLQNQAGGF